MTTPSDSQWHRRRPRAQRRPTWRERVLAHVPRVEVTFTRPGRRGLALIGCCAAVVMLGSSSAAQQLPSSFHTWDFGR